MRQTALASGFADLISTQLASFELERQDELTARVELRALQSQVDPHFLFNTISTIVSLVRTEPDKARSLLIDFSNYYRQTLSDSDTLTTLEHEVEQGTRYINLMQARYGDGRLRVSVDIDFEVPTAWYRRLSCSRCSKTASSMRSARPSRFLFVLGLLRPMTAWRSSSKMTASG